MNFILSSLVNVTSYKWLAIFFTNVIYKYIKMDVRNEKMGIWKMHQRSAECEAVWMEQKNSKPENEPTNELKLNYHHIPYNAVNFYQLFYPFEN